MRCVPRRVIAIGIAVLGPGLMMACSMLPLPEDVSRKSTVDIVQALRCEIKAGLRDIDPHARILKSTVGMDFTFDITENNSTGAASVTFTKLFAGNGSFELKPNAQADKTRQNKREFRILETLEAIRKEQCGTGERAPNIAYPITGRIGLDEVVRTYITIEKSTDLGSRKDSDVVFSDELSFTTDLKAGITPTLKLDAVVGSFAVTNATLAPSVGRKDVHKVIIALAHDPKFSVDGLMYQRLQLHQRSMYRATRAYDGVVSHQLSSRERVIFELDRKKALSEDRLLLESLRLRLQ